MVLEKETDPPEVRRARYLKTAEQFRSEAAAAKTEAGRQELMGLAFYYERIAETIAPPSPPTE